MKKLSWLFAVLAIILSNIMCFVVAYNYSEMMCGIEHKGYSAPVSIAFLYIIPFMVVIGLFVFLSIRFRKK